MHSPTIVTILAALVVLALAFVIGGIVLRLLVGLAVLAAVGLLVRRLLARPA